MAEEGRTIPRQHTHTAEDGVTMAPRQQKQVFEPGDAHAEQKLQVGTLLAGRFVVLEEPERGGMGVVCKCYDKSTKKTVAVKTLPPDVAHDAAEMAAVRRNFDLVDNLRHPNIAKCRDLVPDGGTGGCFLVMEYVDGIQLGDWISSHSGEDGRVPLKQALPVLRQAAEALDYAHSQGVVHCDVKPSNLMLDGDGNIKLIDFGLASRSQQLNGVPMVNGGTVSYMSPEQWREEPVQGTADQYALCVLAYRMLAGRLPFRNDDMHALKRMVLEEDVTPVHGQPTAVQAVLTRAMAKEPEQRFGSCLKFVEALEAAEKEPLPVSASETQAEPEAATAPQSQPESVAEPVPMQPSDVADAEKPKVSAGETQSSRSRKAKIAKSLGYITVVFLICFAGIFCILEWLGLDAIGYNIRAAIEITLFLLALYMFFNDKLSTSLILLLLAWCILFFVRGCSFFPKP